MASIQRFGQTPSSCMSASPRSYVSPRPSIQQPRDPSGEIQSRSRTPSPSSWRPGAKLATQVKFAHLKGRSTPNGPFGCQSGSPPAQQAARLGSCSPRSLVSNISPRPQDLNSVGTPRPAPVSSYSLQRIVEGMSPCPREIPAGTTQQVVRLSSRSPSSMVCRSSPYPQDAGSGATRPHGPQVQAVRSVQAPCKVERCSSAPPGDRSQQDMDSLAHQAQNSHEPECMRLQKGIATPGKAGNSGVPTPSSHRASSVQQSACRQGIQRMQSTPVGGFRKATASPSNRLLRESMPGTPGTPSTRTPSTSPPPSAGRQRPTSRRGSLSSARQALPPPPAVISSTPSRRSTCGATPPSSCRQVTRCTSALKTPLRMRRSDKMQIDEQCPTAPKSAVSSRASSVHRDKHPFPSQEPLSKPILSSSPGTPSLASRPQTSRQRGTPKSGYRSCPESGPASPVRSPRSPSPGTPEMGSRTPTPRVSRQSSPSRYAAAASQFRKREESVREGGLKRQQSASKKLVSQRAELDWFNDVLRPQTTRTQVLDCPLAKRMPLPDVIDVALEELEFYEILGTGSFGAVRRGLFHGQQVAVKQCRVGDPKDVAMLLGEIRCLQSFRHPRLVAFLGCCNKSPDIFMLMEYMQGGSMYDLLFKKKRSIAFEEKARMAVEVCEGLYYLHGLGVVHRDLKTANIVLDRELHCKICDFGLTLMLERTHVTVRAFQGSPRYMAPEQFEDAARITEKVDIWQMGCVMLELFCATKPFETCTGVQQIISELLVRRKPPPVPSGADPRTRALVQASLRIQAPARPTAAALEKALRGAWQGRVEMSRAVSKERRRDVSKETRRERDELAEREPAPEPSKDVQEVDEGATAHFGFAPEMITLADINVNL